MSNNINFNWEQEVIKIAQALQQDDQIDFVYYTDKGKYALVSKIDMKIKFLTGAAFVAKSREIYVKQHGEESPIFNFLSGKAESDLAKELRNCLELVDDFTHYPPFIQKNDKKIKDVNGFKVYNQYNVDATILKLKEEASKMPKIKNVKGMDFKKYPEIAFLIKYLTNEQVNEAYDYNTETGRYDTKVQLSHKLIHWMSALVNTNRKLATCWVFQSKVQGVGKGVIWDELLQHLVGSDFSTPINKDTIIKTNNKAIHNKNLCILEECEIESKKDKVLFNANMKEWITNEQILIREMNVDQRKEYNFTNFMIFTNSDTPFHVEPNCRRNIFCKTPNMKLDAAVRQALKMSMDEFMFSIRATREDFILDLIRLEFDMKFVYNKASMTEAKKSIIMKTNTLGTIFANQCLTNQQAELKDFLVNIAEMDEPDADLICKEINAGIITPTSTGLLFPILQGFEADKDRNKTSKNTYFERLFGSSQKSVNLSEGCSSKQIKCFRFAHFSKARVEALYTPIVLEEGIVERLIDEEQDDVDFSSFMGGF